MSGDILLITASGRSTGSVTRELATELAESLGGRVTHRDVGAGLPVVDDAFLAGYESSEALTRSRELIDELRAHDRIIIAAPMYNFGVPAALKAWIDLVARAGETFRYTETGPVGLLEGKTAYLVVATGGTPVDGSWDYATPYLRHVMNFVGITDVHVVAADRLGNNADKALDGARAAIEELAPTATAA